MREKVQEVEDLWSIVERIHPKFRPVWDGRSREEQLALARYFLPRRSRKANLSPSRPRIIKWYCPFASQSEFPSGHRYCINVFTGCAHQCRYCYAAGYEPENPACKNRFRELILHDTEDLERFDVPPAPVHLSNSTDPFQPLEASSGHTRFTLEKILSYRRRFTTITIITKNPMFPVRNGYLDLFRELSNLPADHAKAGYFRITGDPCFCLEVSIAFWQEDARRFYDPGAPSIEDRKTAVRAIREAGIPIVLRIDPLFPRSPLKEHVTLRDFRLPEAQTIGDLENLVGFAKEVGARHVVYSPAKITQPRGRKMSESMLAMKSAYECVASSPRLPFRGGSWRLPADVAKTRVTDPFLEICRRIGIPAKQCMQNLVETP